MLKEEVYEEVLCTQWDDDGEFQDRRKEYFQVIVDNFKAHRVPSLTSLCFHHIIKNEHELIPAVMEFFPFKVVP